MTRLARIALVLAIAASVGRVLLEALVWSITHDDRPYARPGIRPCS